MDLFSIPQSIGFLAIDMSAEQGDLSAIFFSGSLINSGLSASAFPQTVSVMNQDIPLPSPKANVSSNELLPITLQQASNLTNGDAPYPPPIK